MSVFKDSRFKGSYVFLDENTREKEKITYLSPFRDNILSQQIDDASIVFEQGMRVDILAQQYYGSALLDWVIMDANPKYLSPFDIKHGDVLVLPSPERVTQIARA